MTFSKLLVSCLLSACLWLQTASAGVLITIVEDGPDVLLTYTGTLDLTGYTRSSTSTTSNTYLSPGSGAIYNHIGATMDVYNNILPSSFVYGTGTSTSGGPTSRSGTFALVGRNLYVPTGFTSATLSGEMRWVGKSLADVQVFDGYDVTQFLTGSSTEFITFKTGSAVGGAAVPEPGTSALLLASGVAVVARYRRRKSKVPAE